MDALDPTRPYHEVLDLYENANRELSFQAQMATLRGTLRPMFAAKETCDDLLQKLRNHPDRPVRADDV